MAITNPRIYLALAIPAAVIVLTYIWLRKQRDRKSDSVVDAGVIEAKAEEIELLTDTESEVVVVKKESEVLICHEVNLEAEMNMSSELQQSKLSCSVSAACPEEQSFCARATSSSPGAGDDSKDSCLQTEEVCVKNSKSDLEAADDRSNQDVCEAPQTELPDVGSVSLELSDEVFTAQIEQVVSSSPISPCDNCEEENDMEKVAGECSERILPDVEAATSDNAADNNESAGDQDKNVEIDSHEQNSCVDEPTAKQPMESDASKAGGDDSKKDSGRSLPNVVPGAGLGGGGSNCSDALSEVRYPCNLQFVRHTWFALDVLLFMFWGT